MSVNYLIRFDDICPTMNWRVWEKLAIPEEFDEGFWNTDDLSSYLGADYKLSYYQTYRHFGDLSGSILIYFSNLFLQFF